MLPEKGHFSHSQRVANKIFSMMGKLQEINDLAKGNKLTKIFRKPKIWESDGKLLIDAKKGATCHKIHHKEG